MIPTLNTTAPKENPVHHAVVQISTNKLQIYSCRLHIHARFQGLRYFMYHWRLTTAIVFISTILFWEAYVLRKSWKFVHAVLQEQVIGTEPPVENGNGPDDDEGDDSELDEREEVDPALEMEDLDDEQELLATDSSAENAYGSSTEGHRPNQLAAEYTAEDSPIDIRFPPRGRRPLYSPPPIRASSPPPYGSPGRYSSPPPSMYRTSSGSTWAGAAASGLSYASHMSSSLLKNQRWNSADALDFTSHHRKSANGGANNHRTVKVTVPIQAVEEPVREGGDIRRTTSSAVKGGQRSGVESNGLRYRRRGDGNYEVVANGGDGSKSFVSDNHTAVLTAEVEEDLRRLRGRSPRKKIEVDELGVGEKNDSVVDEKTVSIGENGNDTALRTDHDNIKIEPDAGSSSPGSTWSDVTGEVVARPSSDSETTSLVN
ncbi:hypothetical protein HK097_011189 [Rhizophlyctis rosea]|uniref:Uncharacterized protein n=1 Tax=Rhizophlyctis rosea TaxID=64517 RepID=A0AAD5SLI4_9FUNG|nr:hypothetical protein HK097_011189 [Rhizophlyctis rosea]